MMGLSGENHTFTCLYSCGFSAYTMVFGDHLIICQGDHRSENGGGEDVTVYSLPGIPKRMNT